jgi:hypothetical protein
MMQASQTIESVASTPPASAGDGSEEDAELEHT